MEFDQRSGIPSKPLFKDRQTGLIIFGILQILCATGCLLFIPLLIFGQVVSSRMSGTGPQYQMVLPAIFTYAAMSGVFLVLGIGSIRARRWARAFSLILSWSWLVMGIVGVVVYSFLLPGLLAKGAPGAPALPPAARVVILVISIAFVSAFMVLLPLAFVIFYQSKHVIATCEARNTNECWTDRRPLPILALSTWLCFAAVFLLFMPMGYGGVAPFFGVLLSGIKGAVFYLGLSALFAYLGWRVYKLDRLAWWLILGTILLLGLSNLLTFSRIDLLQMYREMGYPEAQIKQIQQYGFVSTNHMLLWSALGFVPMFCYLFYVRRFFGGGHLPHR